MHQPTDSALWLEFDAAIRKMKLRVLLIGEQSAGIQTLRMLAETTHTVVAVMTTAPSPTGVSSLWRVAKALGYATWPAQLVRTPSFRSRVETEAIDLILNVYSLYLIPGEVLRGARVGAFNCTRARCLDTRV